MIKQRTKNHLKNGTSVQNTSNSDKGDNLPSQGLSQPHPRKLLNKTSKSKQGF